MAIDYYRQFQDLALEHNALIVQRDKIEIELARLAQLLQATFNMLTLAQQVRVAPMVDQLEGRTFGLKQGVLMALKARSGEWLTPPDIRDYLESIGFNFGTDSARGLTSIGTTLRRMVPGELESKPRDNGQTAYRIKGSGPRGIRPGTDPVRNSAYISGMRGNEIPKK